MLRFSFVERPRDSKNIAAIDARFYSVEGRSAEVQAALNAASVLSEGERLSIVIVSSVSGQSLTRHHSWTYRNANAENEFMPEYGFQFLPKKIMRFMVIETRFRAGLRSTRAHRRMACKQITAPRRRQIIWTDGTGVR